MPRTGKLRFLEAKGRIRGAKRVTITKNEILTGSNKPDDFSLAIGLVDGESVDLRYVGRLFRREPDFDANSVNYELAVLLARAEEPP